MTTLTLIVLIGAAVMAAVLTRDALVRASRRRDREIVRRLQRYFDSVPPRSPW